MSLAQLFGGESLSTDAVKMVASSIAQRIHTVEPNVEIILFGSASDGRFRVGSDIDLLLIFENIDCLRTGRKKIRGLGLLHPVIPVDLIFVTRETYITKQDVGGVCFIAKREGVRL